MRLPPVRPTPWKWRRRIPGGCRRAPPSPGPSPTPTGLRPSMRTWGTGATPRGGSVAARPGHRSRWGPAHLVGHRPAAGPDRRSGYRPDLRDDRLRSLRGFALCGRGAGGGPRRPVGHRLLLLERHRHQPRSHFRRRPGGPRRERGRRGDPARPGHGPRRRHPHLVGLRLAAGPGHRPGYRPDLRDDRLRRGLRAPLTWSWCRCRTRAASSTATPSPGRWPTPTGRRSSPSRRRIRTMSKGRRSRCPWSPEIPTGTC